MTPAPSVKLHQYRGLLLRARQRFRERHDPLLVGFEAVRARFYRDLWTDAAREIDASISSLQDEYYRIQRQESSTFVWRSEVALDSRLVLKIAGHKTLCLRLIGEAGFPIPRHVEFDLSDLAPAVGLKRETGKPIVVKPALSGSAGRGVTTGIETSAQLKKAALSAAGFGERLLAEEQVAGESYRLLYLGGQYLDAVRRGRPTVTGDGKRTIRQLVGAENERRLGGKVVSLHPLSIDLEMATYLSKRRLALDFVPRAGEVVELKRVVNQNASRDNDSVRDVVHPTVIEAGRRVSKLLGVDLSGVDIHTPDVRQPLEEVGGVIDEINTTPGLHHHYLVSEPASAARVAPMILEFILSGQ